MSYKFNDGYIKPNSDGYIRVLKDGYIALFTYDGYNVSVFTSTGTDFNNANNTIYINNSTSTPDGYQPINGGWLYSEDGDGYWISSKGNIQSFTSTLSITNFPSDDNYTAIVADYKAKIIEFTGSISTTRDVIMPNFIGQQWTIYNGTTGGQSIVLKVSGQTGVTIANNKRAIVYCNGTDIVRVTPDT